MTDEEMMAAAPGLTDEQMMAASAPEEGGPESFLHPDKFKPSPGHRKFKNTGPIEQVRQDLEESRQATKPIGTQAAFAAPVASALDHYTGGGYGAAFRLDQALADNPIARAVDASPLGPYIGKRGGAVAEKNLEGIDRYRRYHPALSAATDIPGYLGGAPRAFATTVENAIPHAIGPLQRAIGSSALTSAALAGSEAASRGETLPEIARDTGEGAIGGAAIAAPISVGSTLLGKAASKVLGTEGAQARQFLERQGVDVGLTSPGRGGPMKSMVTTGTTDADIGRQAEASAAKGLGMLKDEKGAVLGGLGRRFGKIAQTPEAAQLHDATDIVTKVNDALDDISISPQAEQSLRSALDKVTKAQGKGFNPDVDNYMLSETDLNKLKRRLDRAGRTGQSTDEATQPVRQAANLTRAIVDQGPYAEANADYAKSAKFYQGSRKLLGINERPKTPDETKTAVNTVRHLIERPGQNTITAGGQTGGLAEFKERHPDIGAELTKPEILRKRADISFGLLPKRHGGLIERGGGAIGGLATAEGIMHALGSGHFDLKNAAAAAALGLTLQNLPALQARLLYNPAMNAQLGAQMLLGRAPELAGPGRDLLSQEQR